MPRGMMYNWEGKQAEVYQLYVVERKSLDELVQHMKEKHNFEPSKRAYQTQFKRWQFPSKLAPAHKDEELVARVKQLWENNRGQKEMFTILVDEGYDVSESDLMRLRSKYGWLLRGSQGYQQKPNKIGPRKRNGSQMDAGDDLDDVRDELNAIASGGAQQAAPAIDEPLENPENAEVTQDDPSESQQIVDRLKQPDPELKRQHDERVRELKETSDKLWASKKRRRRTLGFAGLPADPPQPPRYPSETTLDESKAFLHLDNAQYQNAREHFMQICESEGVIKKTVAGPEKWQHVKDRLVAENSNINREFYGPYNGVPHQSKTIALDVICLDVTKRMRTMGARMTLADAKNALCLNPLASRAARAEFYEVLKAARFLSKAESGVEKWLELKTKWISESEMMQERIQCNDENGELLDEAITAYRHKALDVLCRDVMKRRRDDITRADPTLKRATGSGPGPGPAQAKVATPSKRPSTAKSWRQKQNELAMERVTKSRNGTSRKGSSANDAQIDPSLATTLNSEQGPPPAPLAGPSPAELQAFAASAHTPQQGQAEDQHRTTTHARDQSYTPQQQHQHQQSPPHTNTYSGYPPQAQASYAKPEAQPQSVSTDPTHPSRTRPLAALFRLHPSSTVPASHPTTWIGTVTSTSVSDLVLAANPLATRSGTQSAPRTVVNRIEGMITAGGFGTSGESDVPFPIERDDELAAYCGYVVGHGGMGKAVFVCVLEGS